MPTEDFLYENAPLVEVIAELRWNIQRLESLPNAAIDPHFAAFDAEISAKLSSDGFGTIETLVPPNVPIELVANRVLKRFRPEAGKWPVFQIGPGIFAVNVVPPYGGWARFRPTLEKGLQYLFDSYPFADKSLHLRQFELKYIDAFTERLGFHDMRSFLRDYSNFNITLPQGIWDAGSETEPVLMQGEVSLPLKSLLNSRGIVRVGSGQTNNQDAALLELAVRRSGSLDRSEIMKWMDDAHSVLRAWFQLVTNEEMKKRMGPVQPLRSL